MASPVKSELTAREIGGDLILYDHRVGAVHRLNSVAGLIWRLCDGRRDRNAITAELASVFERTPADVGPDVDEILTRFAESGLISWHADSAAPPREAHP